MEGTADQGQPVVGDGGEWRRAAGLFVLLLSFSAVSPAVLVGLPFVMLVMMLPIRNRGALIVSALVLVLSMASGGTSGLWWIERGWALLVGGWFVALTLRAPASRFATRALGASLGAVLTSALFFAVRPMAWGVLDWKIAEKMRLTVGSVMTALTTLRGEEGLTPALTQAVYATAEGQASLFPALAALASMAALGVAWWMYVRLALGRRGALGPLKDFRFNDHLVWLFVAGLIALILGASELWTRAGSNAVVFMGALYALRGAAVVLFVNGGISALGVIAVTLGMVFLAPILFFGALVIGLGDTWLDIRTRAARAANADR